jgi:hypothetical protein
MANPERQGKRLGQQSQGNTARTQDPTSSYGLQKEPMDHVRPQTEKLPQQTRAERIRAAEDDALRPNQGAAEPITQGSSPQRNDPSSPDSSQGTRAAANEQHRIESERPPRNGSPAATGSRK